MKVMVTFLVQTCIVAKDEHEYQSKLEALTAELEGQHENVSLEAEDSDDEDWDSDWDEDWEDE